MAAPSARRACVAAIIRWRPYVEMNPSTTLATSPTGFLGQPWVNDTRGEGELLFIQRALHPGDQ